MATSPQRAEELLVGALRRLPAVDTVDRDELLAEAEPHGLAGVLFEAFRVARIPVGDEMARRAVARELQSEAQRAVLARIDDVFAQHGIDAVVLKGASIARLYPTPSARVSSDVDLLVRPRDLERASDALLSLGYECSDSEAMRRWSLEHHHHHFFAHAASIPVELHFLAYRGLGAEIPSEPLLRRSVPFGTFRALRSLDRADEIAYLAVHAAAHRFGRLGWLYDICLIVRASSTAQLRDAAERARSWGFGHALAFAAHLLEQKLGVTAQELGELGAFRERLLDVVLESPRQPVARAATRFAYSMLIADDLGRSLRYARIAIMQRVRNDSWRHS